MKTMNDVYVSRTDRSAAIIARQDPVIYGAGSYADALGSEQLASYERNGFLLMPDLFTGDEARAFLDEIERLSADPAVAALDEAIAEPRKIGRASCRESVCQYG